MLPNLEKVEGAYAFVLFVHLFVIIPFVILYLMYKIAQRVFELGN